MARPFHEIFAGLDDAYGTYELPSNKTPTPGEKFEGKAKTVKAQVTVEMYYAHLRGDGAGLGVVPIMRDGYCRWFAIDVDVYDPGKDLHYYYADVITKLGLPLIVSRSKSDGVHMWCALTTPLSAIQCQAVAETFLKKLDLPATNAKIKPTEVFPKQTKLEVGETGNWINLPYFGNSRPAVHQGRNLTLDQFLELVEAREISGADAEKWLNQKADVKFPGPPCVEKMQAEGVVEGGRNDALFHVGTFLRKAYPQDWSERLIQWNQDYCEPPEQFSHVQSIIGSLGRKEYEYRCKAQPMVGICNSQECAKRDFGVGNFAGVFDPDFPLKDIILVDGDEPFWKVDINGTWVTVTTQQLFSHKLFSMRVAETTLVSIPDMTVKHWGEAVKILMARAKRETVPVIAQEQGQIIEAFNEWCTRQVPYARDGQAILDGQPYYDQERNVVIFKGMALQKRVSINLPTRIEPSRVWEVMKHAGAIPTKYEWDGREVDVWELSVKEPWFDVPDLEGESF
jgi:hypothetical protein